MIKTAIYILTWPFGWGAVVGLCWGEVFQSQWILWSIVAVPLCILLGYSLAEFHSANDM